MLFAIFLLFEVQFEFEFSEFKFKLNLFALVQKLFLFRLSFLFWPSLTLYSFPLPCQIAQPTLSLPFFFFSAAQPAGPFPFFQPNPVPPSLLSLTHPLPGEPRPSGPSPSSS